MTEKRNLRLERVFTIWGLILIVWAVYRYYEMNPEWVDELILKPLVFLLPVVAYVLKKERRPLASIGLSKGNLYRDIYLGLGFGMLFALEGLVVNSIKYGTFSFAPLVPVTGLSLLIAVFIALATAFSEEVLARGFFFTRLREEYKDEFKALVVSSAMYFMLLVPVVFTVTKLSGVTLLIFVVTNLIMSFANTMIFSETKTVTVPILIHAFWNMAVILYL